MDCEDSRHERGKACLKEERDAREKTRERTAEPADEGQKTAEEGQHGEE